MKTIRCPKCRKESQWEGNPSRPFCSERCRTMDLGAWVSDEYRIAGDPQPVDDSEDEYQ